MRAASCDLLLIQKKEFEQILELLPVKGKIFGPSSWGELRSRDLSSVVLRGLAVQRPADEGDAANALAFSTNPLNAMASLTARSARILRSSTTSAAFRPSVNRL